MAKRAGSRHRQPRNRKPGKHQPASDAGADAPDPLTHFTIFNIKGLKPRTVPTKAPFIQDLLQHKDQLFVALTETWLRDHLDAELNIDGYTLFRQDRNRPRKHRHGRDSGGVAFYLKNSIAGTAEPVLNFSNGVVEVLGLHIKSDNLYWLLSTDNLMISEVAIGQPT